MTTTTSKGLMNMAMATKMAATKAKVTEFRAKLDEKVKEYLEINAKRKALAAKEAELKAEIEANYRLSAEDVEQLVGNEYVVEKVPSFRNQVFNIERLEVLVNAAVIAGADVDLESIAVARTVYDVNKDLLKQLVKDGFVPESAVKKCVDGDYTFSSKFYTKAEFDEKLAKANVKRVKKA